MQRALLTGALLSCVMSNSFASTAIPVTTGEINNYFPLDRLFDNPPMTAPVDQSPADTGNHPNIYDDRYAYFDFGPNYLSWRLSSVHTALRSYSGGEHQGFSDIWWDDDIDNYNDGIDADDLNIGTVSGAPHVNYAAWHTSASFSNPEPLPARYLVVKAGAETTRRMAEVAFFGESDSNHLNDIVTVNNVGAAEGSAYFPLENAFDADVTWGTGNAIPFSTGGQADAPYYGDRVGYIDFGVDYSQVLIGGTWTQYRQWSHGDQVGFSEMWWDDDIDTLNDGTTETRLAFNSAQSLVNTGNATPWIQDVNLSDAPIAPPQRFLMMRSAPNMTNRAKEYAISGYKTPLNSYAQDTVAQPEPVFDTASMTLVDEVFPAQSSSHSLLESSVGVSRVRTILGEDMRVLQPHQDEPRYFAYQMALSEPLAPHKAYVLVVEYPQDAPRSMFISNSANDSVKGFHSGNTMGDAMTPPYVNPNAESLNIPLSGEMERWSSLFHMHERTYAGIERHRSAEEHTAMPDDGVWITVSVLPENDDPTNMGAAISRIAIYEAPETLPSNSRPLAGTGMERQLFWREEMADATIIAKDANYRAMDDPVDWFRHRANRAQMMGFNTFAINLLEFGHVQYWDSNIDRQWYVPSQTPWLWEGILQMLSTEFPDLAILPYYEYTGGTASLGDEKRAKPLNDDENYTHIWWSERFNVDITDPDTLAEAKQLLDETIIKFNQPRPQMTADYGADNQVWYTNRWGYIDLGEDYADWRIQEAWTQVTQYKLTTGTPFQGLYWSDTPEGFTDINPPSTALAETRFNFMNVAIDPGSSMWFKDDNLTTTITPPSRYLFFLTPSTTFDRIAELAFVGHKVQTPNTTEVLSPVYAGPRPGGQYDLGRLFDAQPQLVGGNINFAGAWFRPRNSAWPISFADATRARYADDRNLADIPTKSDLQNDSNLKADYDSWWFTQRRNFLAQIRQHLTNALGDEATVLFTFDATETGADNPIEEQPDFFTDNSALAQILGLNGKDITQAIDTQWQWNALTQPVRTWSTWEWHHSVPAGDPWNYDNTPNVLQTYSYNRAYTVQDSNSIDNFRSDQGLAMIHHLPLNEDVMEHTTGYFVGDMERTGKYALLNDARAVANGMPEHLGFLSSGVFNTGAPEYMRAFTQAFLALPALPSTQLAGSSNNENVVVRQIVADGTTYLAVVNTGVLDAAGVELSISGASSITDSVTGEVINLVDGVLAVDLWAGQLRAFTVN